MTRCTALRWAVSVVCAVGLNAGATAIAAPQTPAEKRIPAAPASTAPVTASSRLGPLSKARRELERLAPRVQSISDRVKASREERKQLDTTRSALERKWKQQRAAAKQAHERFTKASPASQAKPETQKLLETARDEYRAALASAAELARQRTALDALEVALHEQAQSASKLRAELDALSATFKDEKTPLDEGLRKLGTELEAVATLAGQVKTRSGFATATALQTAQAGSEKKLAAIAVTLEDIDERSAAIKAAMEREKAQPAVAANTPGGIEGIELGMTLDQVRAVLKKSPTPLQETLSYSSVAVSLAPNWDSEMQVTEKTPGAFPDLMRVTGKDIDLNIDFSHPPKQARVLSVLNRRVFHQNPAKAPTLSSYRADLVKARGTPASEKTGDHKVTYTWLTAKNGKGCTPTQWHDYTTRAQLSQRPENCSPIVVADVFTDGSRVSASNITLGNVGQVVLDNEGFAAHQQAWLRERKAAEQNNPSCDIEKIDWHRFGYPAEAEVDVASRGAIHFADLDGNGRREAYANFQVLSCNPRAHTLVIDMKKGPGCPLSLLGIIEHNGPLEIAGKTLRAVHDACATCGGGESICPDDVTFDEYRFVQGRLQQSRQGVLASAAAAPPAPAPAPPPALPAASTDLCQHNLGMSSASVSAFWKTVQQAVAKEDKRGLEALLAFPGGPFKNPADFQARYATFFTPAVRKAVTAASTAEPFCNYQGTMIADGTLWAGPAQGSQLRIIAVNKR